MLPLLSPSLPGHWASLSLSRTRAVQEGEPRARITQSELAWQKSSGEADTAIPMHAQPWLPFCPAYPSSRPPPPPPPPLPSPASVPVRLLSLAQAEQQWVSLRCFSFAHPVAPSFFNICPDLTYPL